MATDSLRPISTAGTVSFNTNCNDILSILKLFIAHLYWHYWPTDESHIHVVSTNELAIIGHLRRQKQLEGGFRTSEGKSAGTAW